ncbi:mms19 nucleotide excision repair [Kappamyces sp. JEL0680]|nr:mms19 nucleotide excision repair [Kappamyces sp. JEL0680]
MAQGAEEENELSALKCIRELVKALSKSVLLSSDSTTPLERILGLMIPDCHKNFKDGDLKFARPCGKILMSAASSCQAACTAIVEKTLVVLFEEYEREESPSKKKILLEVVTDLILASRLVNGTKTETADQGNPPATAYAPDMASSAVTPFKEQCIETFVSVLLAETHEPLQIVALNGLYELLASSGLLVESEVELLLSHINALAIRSSSDTTAQALANLEKLAKDQPNLVETASSLYFLQALKEFKTLQEAAYCLNALTTIAFVPNIFQNISGKLYGILAIFSRDAERSSALPLVLSAILSCTKKVNKCKLAKDQIAYIQDLVQDEILFDMIVQEPTLRQTFADILNVTVRSLKAG